MKNRNIALLFCLMAFLRSTSVLGQSSFLEQTTPNPASAKLFFYDRTYNGETDRNWKIATLPSSSAGTGDKVQIELFGGTFSGSGSFEQKIHLGNRNGFSGYLRTELGSPYSSVRIRAYEQNDGKVDVYLTLLSAGYKGACLKVYDGSAITVTRLTIYENPTNVGPTPTGTIVFDSYDETAGIATNNSGDTFLKGNVGIGTTTPSEKLEVNGTIRTQEVKVESTGWPDYVFSDTYQLNPLSEVSTYIQENHHLPGIPTAQEVAKNGIKLGEMNAKLLEKVEELTLYLIEMKEENEALKQKDLIMIQRIEKLENQIKNEN